MTVRRSPSLEGHVHNDAPVDSPLPVPGGLLDGGPARVEAFWLEPVAVTNARFAQFVAAAGYRTDAEAIGWSFVFAQLLPSDFGATAAVADAPWWRQVHGASWRRPEGPGSGLSERWSHPVVHVSLRDAIAFCRWNGRRLPSDHEWEQAARGGLLHKDFPWGDELEPGGDHRMNVWQGDFPSINTRADGYHGTAPVDAYRPNAYGLYNITGNVWEWTADGTLRGGSYLCHASYCRRYRVTGRQVVDPTSSSGHAGFRCAMARRSW
jgi:sulfatase modifying factor 1